MKRYRMTITALSPIHIGTGEELSPFEYIIKEDLFCRIDLTALLGDLTERQRTDFDQAVNSGQIAYVRRFIADNVQLKRHALYVCSVNDTLKQAYEKNLANPRNQLLVHPHLRRLDTHQPIIPGSSIKGAIRTSIVSAKITASPHEDDVRRNRFEGEVLGYYNDIRQDPFRCLQIADATLPADAIGIEPAVIFKPDRGDMVNPEGIQMFYEMTFSKLDEENIAAEADLAINDDLPHKEVYDRRSRQNRTAVSMPLDMKAIRQYCLDFYRPKIEAEHNKFYRTSEELNRVNAPLSEETFGQQEFPIRLGRFSHVECVTVDRFRRPKTRRDPRTGQLLGWGGTRTLAARLYHMVWAKVSLQPLT